MNSSMLMFMLMVAMWPVHGEGRTGLNLGCGSGSDGEQNS